MTGLLDGTITTAPTRIRPPGKKMHRLAYIDPEEAALLRSRGGGVTKDGGQAMHQGVPAFWGDDSGANDGSANSGPGGDTNDSTDGGGWNSGNGIGEGPTQALPAAPPPLAPEVPRPTFDLNPTPVYTEQPTIAQAPQTGVTPLGIAQALQAMRSMFGPRPLPGGPPGGAQAPVYAGGGIPSQVPGGNNAWTPPVIAPNAPQQPILTGQGGNTDYYAALQRLAPQQAGGMSWGDPTHRMW